MSDQACLKNKLDDLKEARAALAQYLAGPYHEDVRRKLAEIQLCINAIQDVMAEDREPWQPSETPVTLI